MKNIYLLPTDKPSRLFDDGMELYFGELKNRRGHPVTSYNIYITSNEEIKEGDYMLLKHEHSHGRIRKCHYIYEEQLMIDAKEDIGFGFCKRNEVYKITLTTDQDLIADGVQAIDDEFLEWFAKNLSCEVVEVNWVKTPDGIFYHQENVPYGCYKIIIPKEELTKDEIDKFFVDMVCNPKEPKQETLEEAANKAYCFYGDVELREAFELGAKWQQEQEKITTDDAYNEGFENGKHWQQERSYSEEEVLNINNWYLETFLDDTLGLNGKDAEQKVKHLSGKGLTKEVLNYYFEQFKK